VLNVKSLQAGYSSSNGLISRHESFDFAVEILIKGLDSQRSKKI